jgi:uncharacterized protein HemX
MPEGKLTKMATLGDAISAWGKIAFTVILIIGYGFLTYYQIKGNSQGISELKLMIEDLRTYDQREIEILSNRSNKRYDRIEAELEELKDEVKTNDREDIETIKELYYLKGQLNK